MNPLPRDRGWRVPATTTRSADERCAVEFRLSSARDGSLKIFDFGAEGLSLIRTYRGRLATLLAREGIDAVIKELRIAAG
ncbi:ABC transporter substrate-binding protein [Embleya sp. NPDC020630]|uniref:ABC transporter substrate-binding protein n=1 Tax=Embleya sp. NPDC020630 TaxID=3363979 RepID=UPI00378E6383